MHLSLGTVGFTVIVVSTFGAGVIVEGVIIGVIVEGTFSIYVVGFSGIVVGGISGIVVGKE